ncbi:MAG: type II secretion system protein [Sideroxydans sp.]|nr:type II secretion system protein [Sideroxydans sp.]
MSAHPDKGFTLIELLITLAILGILATMAWPMGEMAVQRSKEQELRQSLREIRNGLDAYKQAVEEGRIAHSLIKSGYPPSLQVLVEGVPDAHSANGKGRIFFLRHIPRDPMSAAGPDIPDEETWGTRSYESSADQPEAGDDVFDVYSLSGAVGMNGIPYRNW